MPQGSSRKNPLPSVPDHRISGLDFQQLQSFLEHVPAAIAIFDRDMKYILTSRRWLEDYNLKEKNIVGRSHYDVFPGLPDRWKEVHRRCLAGATERCPEDSFAREDGKIEWVGWEIRPWYQPDGQVGGIIMFTEVITEAKRSREVLRESEERFRRLIENSTDVIALVDAQGTITYAIPSIARILGYSVDDFLGRNIFELVHPEDLPRIQARFAEILQKSEVFVEDACRFLHKDGSWRWLDGSGKNLLEEESVRAIVINARDITDRKLAEQSLQESEERFRMMSNTAPVMIWRAGTDGRCMFVNKTWLDFRGRTIEEELGNGWSEGIHPDDLQGYLDLYLSFFRERKSFQMEYRLRRHDGQYRWVLDAGVPIFLPSGEFNGYIGSCIDVTERKKAADQIKVALQEKDLLLKEVHHRVKNNLQVISSLFDLQADEIADEKMRQIMVKNQQRVRAISLVHDMLYQSKKLSRIDFAEYVNGLSRSLAQMHDRGDGRVNIIIEIDDIYLDINRAIPCGLIINEIVTNSLKHAFPEERNGEIKISFVHRVNSLEYHLCISDNGCGLHGSVDILQRKSLGMEIVKALANQLGGEISFKNGRGVTFELIFK